MLSGKKTAPRLFLHSLKISRPPFLSLGDLFVNYLKKNSVNTAKNNEQIQARRTATHYTGLPVLYRALLFTYFETMTQTKQIP